MIEFDDLELSLDNQCALHAYLDQIYREAMGIELVMLVYSTITKVCMDGMKYMINQRMRSAKYLAGHVNWELIHIRGLDANMLECPEEQTQEQTHISVSYISI